MKKILLSILVSVSLIACTNQEAKTETKIEETTETDGSITTTGPDVELMKNSFTYFANGDWANLALCYADSAKAFHNVWASSTDTTVGVNVQNIIEGFKKQREYFEHSPQLWYQ